MTSCDGYYEIASWSDSLYVRVIGLATMFNVGAVRDLMAREIEQGKRRVIFDLEDCDGMDSTFLGVIAGVALGDDDQQVEVDIINASVENMRLIEGLGLTEIVTAVRGRVTAPKAKLTPLYDRTQESERLELVLSAHGELVRLSKENEAVFGELIKQIKEEADQKGLDTTRAGKRSGGGQTE